MVDFKKHLKAAQSNWKKAKKRVATEGSGFVELPDGPYTARLVGAKIAQSANKRLQVDFDWQIVDGEFEKKHKHNYQGIETEENLFYLGRELERLGYELPDDLEVLPEILADIEKSKPVAAINLRTKGDFQNLYIRKVYDADEDAEDDDDQTEEETEETDDDVEETDDETEEDTDEESDEETEEETDEESDEESEDEETDDAAEEEGDDDAEEGEEESDEDEIEISEDMRVLVETAKGREAGVIIEVLEDEEKVRVKLDNGKTVRVPVEKIEVEPVKKPAKKEKEPAKKPAASKKPAPAPAKKPAPAASKKPAPGKKKTGKK